MNIKQMKSIVVILAATAIIGTNLNAQVLSDVLKVYNEGAALAKTDIPAAIKSFEEVVSLADKVGAEADDLRGKAVKYLPAMYYRLAVNTVSDKKPAAEIIKAAKTAIAAAEKYNSPTTKDNALKVLAKGYTNMGSEFYSANDLDNALLAFDSVLTVTPGALPIVYNKALIYKKQGNSDSFEQTMDFYLAQLKSTNDTVNFKTESAMVLEYFRAAGSKANQAGNLDEAIVQLDKAAKYGDDKNVFYYYADVYNKQKNFDRGEEFAQKGLDLETGDAEAKAKYYYQLAVAQVGKGNTGAACESFKNALYGAFADAAKAQRTNLKCQ